MEQKFLDKLKRVKIADIFHIFMFIFALPVSFFVRLKRRNIWLLCDTRYEAGDNAFWLFKYIRENKKDTDVIFALDKKSLDYDKVSQLGKVVDYGSFMHWVYYLSASKNVSSQKMGKPNAAICYVLEVYLGLRNNRAFLQHGIITADLTFLHYPHTKMKLFVTSTKDEWQYVNEVYEYPSGAVRELGLCRFDALHNYNLKEKQILIMPTWRMYIRNEISGDKESVAAKFMETEYFKLWNGLINDEEFIRFVEKEQIEVVFYPHREMHAFIGCFDINSDNIRMLSPKECDVQSLLKESAYLITDYSSVSMDFAYMKKPLLYYQFDYEKFRSGHHPEGYFSFEKDGFGKVCKDVLDVVSTVKNTYTTDSGFVNDTIYLQRHKEYFDLYDSNNCKRNYEAISMM